LTEGQCEIRKFRFSKPESSGFQLVYHYSARDLPFHPSFSLPLTARHKHCSGEVILG
jgi:hypothetical protein